MFEYRPYSKQMQLGQKDKELPKLIVKKPKKKPVYRQVITNKEFKATDRNRRHYRFTGDEEIVKWVAIMVRKDVNRNENTKAY